MMNERGPRTEPIGTPCRRTDEIEDEATKGNIAFCQSDKI